MPAFMLWSKPLRTLFLRSLLVLQRASESHQPINRTGGESQDKSSLVITCNLLAAIRTSQTNAGFCSHFL